MAFEASLVPRRRDCPRDELGLWLVIDSESHIDHAAGGSTEVPLRELPARWRETAPESVVILRSSGGDSAARAAVRADHMLRSWGLEVEHDGGRSGASWGPRVELATRASAPASWVGLDSMLDDAPRALGVVDATSAVLRILARSDEGLPQVVRAVGEAQFRQLCGPGACLVADTHGEGQPARQDSSPVALDVVATLASAGFPDGWQGSGEGRHLLAFDWSPPAGAVIERWPVLYIPVRWSGGRAADGSVLSVRIAGRGVASFDLSEFEPNETTELEIRIPKAWWSRTAWPIEVEASLVTDDDRCTQRSGDRPWLVVEPEARLRVPYTAPAPSGIAGWFAGRLEDGVTVPVTWSSPTTPAQAQQVAALLFPLSEVGGGPGYSFETDVGDVPAVRVLVEPSSVSGISVDEAGSGTHWLDKAGVFSVPLVEADRVAYLGLTGPGLEFVPARHADDVPVPPLGGMVGRKALLTSDGRWEPFDVPQQAEPGASASTEVLSHVDPSAPASRESNARRMLDLLWLVCSAVIVGLVILILRRRATA